MIEDFNYTNHYKIDAEKFDYFENRKGASAHDERRVREFVASMVAKKHKIILDVGSGSAWAANTFIKKGKKVISLDISLNNALKAKKINPHPEHFVVVADSLNLPFRNSCVDCVIASEVIEHIIEPCAFANELFRVVKVNGDLIISTPYKETIQYTLCIHCNKITPLHAHLHSFDEFKLLNLLDYKDNVTAKLIKFGNKWLIFSGTYILLRYLNFGLWRIVDAIFNLIIRKPAHIIAALKKTK